jgi:group I intron endonuclease
VYIYKITNQINGKSYIGLDTKPSHLQSRWKNHKRNMNHVSGHLYNAFRKYGIDNFIFEVLEEATSLADLVVYGLGHFCREHNIKQQNFRSYADAKEN